MLQLSKSNINYSLQQNVLNVEITENSEISKFVWPICKHIEKSNVRICMLWKCY